MERSTLPTTTVLIPSAMMIALHAQKNRRSLIPQHDSCILLQYAPNTGLLAFNLHFGKTTFQYTSSQPAPSTYSLNLHLYLSLTLAWFNRLRQSVFLLYVFFTLYNISECDVCHSPFKRNYTKIPMHNLMHRDNLLCKRVQLFFLC